MLPGAWVGQKQYWVYLFILHFIGNPKQFTILFTPFCFHDKHLCSRLTLRRVTVTWSLNKLPWQNKDSNPGFQEPSLILLPLHYAYFSYYNIVFYMMSKNARIIFTVNVNGNTFVLLCCSAFSQGFQHSLFVTAIT